MKTVVLEYMGIKKIIAAAFLGYFFIPLLAFGAIIYTQPYKVMNDNSGRFDLLNDQLQEDCKPCAILDRALFNRYPDTHAIIPGPGGRVRDFGGTITTTGDVPRGETILPYMVSNGVRYVGLQNVMDELDRLYAAQITPPHPPVTTPLPATPPVNQPSQPTPPTTPQQSRPNLNPIDPANYIVKCEPVPKPPATATSYECEIYGPGKPPLFTPVHIPGLDRTIYPKTPPFAPAPFDAIAQAVTSGASIFYNPITGEVKSYPLLPAFYTGKLSCELMTSGDNKGKYRCRYTNFLDRPMQFFVDPVDHRNLFNDIANQDNIISINPITGAMMTIPSPIVPPPMNPGPAVSAVTIEVDDKPRLNNVGRFWVVKVTTTTCIGDICIKTTENIDIDNSVPILASEAVAQVRRQLARQLANPPANPRPPQMTPGATPPARAVTPPASSEETRRRMQAELDKLKKENGDAEAELKRRRDSAGMPPANP